MLLSCLFCGIAATVQAQVERAIVPPEYRLDSAHTRELRLKVDNLSFFKDNEFSGNIMKGYSLPGLWVEPRLTYQPLKNIRLDAGLHALIYHGTYHYPNYAYRDIAQWKGSEYQKGAHLLPIFRAQVAMRRCNIVLGNLYGAGHHRLLLPLYNPELNLTADPENGVQVLYDHPRLHLDVWVNWESFIFEGSTHQEAFIVGLSSRLNLNKPESRVHCYLPVQGCCSTGAGNRIRPFPCRRSSTAQPVWACAGTSGGRH